MALPQFSTLHFICHTEKDPARVHFTAKKNSAIWSNLSALLGWACGFTQKMNNVYSGGCLRNLKEDFVRDMPELWNDDLGFSIPQTELGGKTLCSGGRFNLLAVQFFALQGWKFYFLGARGVSILVAPLCQVRRVIQVEQGKNSVQALLVNFVSEY